MSDTWCCDNAKAEGRKAIFHRWAKVVRYGLIFSVALTMSSATILSSARAEVVWLDFAGAAWPSFSGKVDTDFEDAVLAAVVADYAEFPWLSFTKTTPGGSDYTQLEFSDSSGASLGSAHIVDWGNLIKNHNNVVRPDGSAGSAADVFVAGFVSRGSPVTSSFDQFTTAVGGTASHELGHTLGLRHFDTFGPATITGNPNPEANHHIMATDSTGLSDAERADYDRAFSEHSRDKLHYLDPLNQPSRKRAEISPAPFAHSSTLTAEPLTIRPSDTIAAVGRQIMVKEASIAAVGEVDYYSFMGTAGDKVYANVVSKGLRYPLNPLFTNLNPIDSRLTLFDPGFGIAYVNDDTGYNATSGGTPGIGDADATGEYGIAEDAPFNSRTFDSILIDSPTGDYFTLTMTGAWYIGISSTDGDETGDYELFVAIDRMLELLFGDISGDNVVDIGDFTLWGNDFGQTGIGLPADLSADDTVDIGDFTIWADHFGETLGPVGAGQTTSAVPEPSTLSLFGIGLVAFVYWARRNKRAAA